MVVYTLLLHQLHHSLLLIWQCGAPIVVEGFPSADTMLTYGVAKGKKDIVVGLRESKEDNLVD